MSETKLARSIKTGRVAQLPPQIYNNPFRMKEWQLIESPDDVANLPKPKPTIGVRSSTPVQTITTEPVEMPDIIKQALGIQPTSESTPDPDKTKKTKSKPKDE